MLSYRFRCSVAFAILLIITLLPTTGKGRFLLCGLALAVGIPWRDKFIEAAVSVIGSWCISPHLTGCLWILYAGTILRSQSCGFIGVCCMRVRLVGPLLELLECFWLRIFFVTGIFHLSYTPQYEGSEVVLGRISQL